jgi:hypothetical protein
MFTVELYAKIRRAVMVEGVSRREAARRRGRMGLKVGFQPIFIA